MRYHLQYSHKNEPTITGLPLASITPKSKIKASLNPSFNSHSEPKNLQKISKKTPLPIRYQPYSPRNSSPPKNMKSKIQNSLEDPLNISGYPAEDEQNPEHSDEFPVFEAVPVTEEIIENNQENSVKLAENSKQKNKTSSNHEEDPFSEEAISTNENFDKDIGNLTRFNVHAKKIVNEMIFFFLYIFLKILKVKSVIFVKLILRIF